MGLQDYLRFKKAVKYMHYEKEEFWHSFCNKEMYEIGPIFRIDEIIKDCITKMSTLHEVFHHTNSSVIQSYINETAKDLSNLIKEKGLDNPEVQLRIETMLRFCDVGPEYVESALKNAGHTPHPVLQKKIDIIKEANGFLNGDFSDHQAYDKLITELAYMKVRIPYRMIMHLVSEETKDELGIESSIDGYFTLVKTNDTLFLVGHEEYKNIVVRDFVPNADLHELAYITEDVMSDLLETRVQDKYALTQETIETRIKSAIQIAIKYQGMDKIRERETETENNNEKEKIEKLLYNINEGYRNIINETPSEANDIPKPEIFDDLPGIGDIPDIQYMKRTSIADEVLKTDKRNYKRLPRIGDDPKKIPVIGDDPDKMIKIGDDPDLLPNIGDDPQKMPRIGDDPDEMIKIGDDPNLEDDLYL